MLNNEVGSQYDPLVSKLNENETLYNTPDYYAKGKITSVKVFNYKTDKHGTEIWACIIKLIAAVIYGFL